jgi:hypothetical protein
MLFREMRGMPQKIKMHRKADCVIRLSGQHWADGAQYRDFNPIENPRHATVCLKWCHGHSGRASHGWLSRMSFAELLNVQHALGSNGS